MKFEYPSNLSHLKTKREGENQQFTKMLGILKILAFEGETKQSI